MPYRLRKAPNRDLYWVIAQDGTKKSKEPIPLERAKAQMRALYASEQSPRRGGRLMDKFMAALGVPKRPIIQRIIDVVRGVRMDYRPRVRALLKQIGNEPIVSMMVRRDPIQTLINTALNLITKGKWEASKKKYHYDELFHLSLEVAIHPNKNSGEIARYTIEKNEVINIEASSPIHRNTEMMTVPMSHGATINSLLNGGKEMMKERFFPYHPFFNNCQSFIIGLLQGSGFLTPSLQQFIKQDIEEMVSELPSETGTIAKTVTDIAALGNVWLEGRGGGGHEPNARLKKQLDRLGIRPSVYLEKAREAAKHAGYPHYHLGFADDDDHKLQIPNNEGEIIRFGKAGMMDFLLYTLSNDPNADQHRKAYRARATRIRGAWKKDPYSPNSLSLSVQWPL